MLKTKKAILGIVLGALMALCLIVGITGLSKPQKAQAWGEGESWDNVRTFEGHVYNNEFLEHYKNSEGHIGNLNINLNGKTWYFSETVNTSSLEIGCLRISNGTIEITEDIESDNLFEIYGGLEFDNVTFVGHSIEVNHLVEFNGVSRGWGRCNITNCKFISCDSDTNGGVFYFDFSDGFIDKINITDCTFDSCWSSGSGSVIYVNNAGKNDASHVAHINLKGSKFVNCRSDDDDGGVIYVNDEYVEIGTCGSPSMAYFWNCGSHNDGGGAIYLNQNNCNVLDCIFDSCLAYDYGGAIYINDVNCHIGNCEFYQCWLDFEGEGDGSAIFSNKICTIDDCTFINNCSYKNACYFTARANITGCIFSNKHNYGGTAPSVLNCEIDNTGDRKYEINLGTGTIMTDGSLAILFGVLAGVFLIASGTFAYLYFAGKKKKKN